MYYDSLWFTISLVTSGFPLLCRGACAKAQCRDASPPSNSWSSDVPSNILQPASTLDENNSRIVGILAYGQRSQYNSHSLTFSRFKHTLNFYLSPSPVNTCNNDISSEPWERKQLGICVQLRRIRAVENANRTPLGYKLHQTTSTEKEGIIGDY